MHGVRIYMCVCTYMCLFTACVLCIVPLSIAGHESESILLFIEQFVHTLSFPFLVRCACVQCL